MFISRFKLEMVVKDDVNVVLVSESFFRCFINMMDMMRREYLRKFIVIMGLVNYNCLLSLVVNKFLMFLLFFLLLLVDILFFFVMII